MPSLSILSRDAGAYVEALGALSLPDLEIQISTDSPDAIDPPSVQFLLADPDLAVRIITQCHQLEWLQSTFAGNAPLIRAPRTDYELTAAQGIFGQPMREYVATYLLYFSRNMQALHPRLGTPDAVKPERWAPPPIGTLSGKTLGIVGAGNIGGELIELARLFNMNVWGLNQRGESADPYDRIFSSAHKLAFAKDLDYLLCLLPDTPATDGFIDATFLSATPDHCVLINAGRGNSIDETALLEALERNTLRAAVLDVFDTEPLPEGHPFWQHPKIWVTQHTAALSDPQAVASVFAHNYRQKRSGQPLAYRVDFHRGY